MENDQNAPAMAPGKRFFEISEETARGIEILKQLDEAFTALLFWVREVWGEDDFYPYEKQTLNRMGEINRWSLGMVTTLIGGTLDATNFTSI